MRHGIYLLNIGEVPSSIMLPIPCDVSIVELFDLFSGDISSFSKGYGKCGEFDVFDIPFWSFDKGFLVIEETGLGILKVFLQLVGGCLVFLGLDTNLLLIAFMTAF